METGYVKFENKNWSYTGDRGTWAYLNADKNIVIICKARKGTISSAYLAEITEYCNTLGVDFAALDFGQKITVNL